MAVDGNRIRQLRNDSGLTQEALGKKLGVIKQIVSSWENNISEPNSEVLSKIASVFNVSIGYLYENTSSGIDYANYQMDSPEFSLAFKMRIRDLMAEQKMSEEEFAQRAGFNYEEKDSYLYGNRIPSIEDLIKIAGSLNVSTDYLLDISKRKHISAEEEMLLQSFNRCDKECKKYLISEAGVLCVEGISAVAAGEYGKYVDEEKKHFLRVVPEEKGLKKKNDECAC